MRRRCQPGDGQALVRQIYLSLDPTSRGWAAGATYLPPVPLEGVMRGFGLGGVEESRDPGLAAGDYVQGLLGWQMYAVIRRAELDELPPTRTSALRHMAVLGPHRRDGVLRSARGWTAEAGRDAGRVRRGGRGRLARRADRQDRRVPCRRRRRQRREVPLADWRAWLRRRGQLQGGAGPRRPAARVPQRHRRALRERRRSECSTRSSRSSTRGHASCYAG